MRSLQRRDGLASGDGTLPLIGLQHVAEVLSVWVAELQDAEEPSSTEERPEAFDTIRLALTGHPAIGSVLGTVEAAPDRQVDALRGEHAKVWELVHASRYNELAPILAELIPSVR